MTASVALASWATMHIKTRCYDRRARMPLLFKVDKLTIISSNILAYTCLVMWANLLPDSAVSRLELMILVDILAGIIAQRWLLSTIHDRDTRPYHEPGPLCTRNRNRRMKIDYVIVTMSAGWCAALSMAAKPYTEEHYCSHFFIAVVLPSMYALFRTLMLDMPPSTNGPMADLAQEQEEITNAFTIDDETEERDDLSIDGEEVY